MPRDNAPRWALIATTLALFAVWSNSFIAIGYLLGSERSGRALDWIELPLLRYSIVSVLAGLYCFGLRGRESLAIVRRHWPRLLAASVFNIPGYNLFLTYGQQHGVPAPVASLETAIAPLFLMILGSVFLGERLSRRKLLGFSIAFAGLVVIASAKEIEGALSYPGLIALTALAPLCFSIYSVISKPVTRKVSPILWTYLVVITGTIPLALFAPREFSAAARLDAAGWGALIFLAVACTLFGFAAWMWLLSHLPASTVGFTIFLNPPLTTVSKAVLAAALPAVFAFQIVGREWLGGAIVLAGIAAALIKPRR